MSSSPDLNESSKPGKGTTKAIAVTGISLLGIFIVFFLMGLSDDRKIAGLSTVDNSSLIGEENAHSEESGSASIYHFHPVKKIVPEEVYMNAFDSTDTTKTRVLLIGDSEVDYLRLPVYNYCKNNNCELVATVVWYGSTTVSWGETDSLKNYLEKYNPDFVFCVLGLNELFIPNVEPRRKSVRNIVSTIRQSGAKYYWIGPAAWKKDQGICDMLNEELDSLCYPSQNLALERTNDHRHPSRDGSKVWFDSVAVAVTKDTRLCLRNPVVKYEQPQNCPSIVIPMSK